jgi:hypothetical protein
MSAEFTRGLGAWLAMAAIVIAIVALGVGFLLGRLL